MLCLTFILPLKAEGQRPRFASSISPFTAVTRSDNLFFSSSHCTLFPRASTSPVIMEDFGKHIIRSYDVTEMHFNIPFIYIILAEKYLNVLHFNGVMKSDDTRVSETTSGC